MNTPRTEFDAVGRAPRPSRGSRPRPQIKRPIFVRLGSASRPRTRARPTSVASTRYSRRRVTEDEQPSNFGTLSGLRPARTQRRAIARRDRRQWWPEFALSAGRTGLHDQAFEYPVEGAGGRAQPQSPRGGRPRSSQGKESALDQFASGKRAGSASAPRADEGAVGRNSGTSIIPKNK